MGIQKQKWTQEEEDALIAGVEKHGPGKWKNILIDPKFAPFLATRTNVDLKDKWRNLNVSNGSRVPRLKAASAASAALQNATPAAALTHQAAPSESDQDVKNVPTYNTMIFEALTTLKDANGSDLNAIVSFIEVFNRLGALLSKFEPEEVEVLLLAHEVRLEKYKKEKHEVPQNFRRELTTRLRRLVSQGSLEKVQNCYKIKREASLGTKPQGQSPVSGSMVSNDPMKEAADNAAYTVADAENKSYLAAEAVKELERLSLMAEDTDLMLQLATEFYEKCSRDGDLLRAMQGL